jgi:hypothetical protein
MSAPAQETAFDLRRGIQPCRLETGYAQVHVSGLPDPVHDQRLAVLELLKRLDVGLFFLRLTPSGLSFLVRDESVDRLEAPLQAQFEHASIKRHRSVVFVKAANIRDEEGLLGGILATALLEGDALEHLGDMHDCVCIAAEHESAERIARLVDSHAASL